jgi:hypothetical protein
MSKKIKFDVNSFCLDEVLEVVKQRKKLRKKNKKTEVFKNGKDHDGNRGS